MFRQKSLLKPLIELITATAFWGASFPCTVLLLRQLDTAAFTFYRFNIFAAGGLILYAFRLAPSPEAASSAPPQISFWVEFKNEITLALPSGVWLFLTIVLQAWGMLTTTATKSAFLTILYVIIIPIITTLTGQERLGRNHFLSVLLALVGISVFQNLQISNWSRGDTITLGGAVAASFHILSVGRAAAISRNPFLFNIGQALWSASFSLFLFPFTARWDIFSLNAEGFSALAILGLGSGLVAFYLQIRAQERIPPSLAGMLFLLECPFSALIAFWVLRENIESHHLWGGALILTACAWACRSVETLWEEEIE
ncbi:MAG: hypothetical protein C5B49_00910 [Bdellovibrio sp.]|nr:MAG: hypothetical protein C5B49_00910 [Bdellovibrio sp.]